MSCLESFWSYGSVVAKNNALTSPRGRVKKDGCDSLWDVVLTTIFQALTFNVWYVRLRKLTCWYVQVYFLYTDPLSAACMSVWCCACVWLRWLLLQGPVVVIGINPCSSPVSVSLFPVAVGLLLLVLDRLMWKDRSCLSTLCLYGSVSFCVMHRNYSVFNYLPTQLANLSELKWWNLPIRWAFLLVHTHTHLESSDEWLVTNQ